MKNKKTKSCTICKKFDPSDSNNVINKEQNDVYMKIVRQIKDMFGLELLVDEKGAMFVCSQCHLDFKTVTEFHQKCLESNEFFDRKSLENDENVLTKYEVIFENSENDPLDCEDNSHTNCNNEHLPSNNFKSENSNSTKQSKNDKDICDGEDSYRSDDNANKIESDCSNKSLSKRKRKNAQSSKQSKIDKDGNMETTTCDGSNMLSIETKKSKNNVRERQPQKFICHVCGNIYKNRIILDLHMQRHNQDKRFKCELATCCKSFHTTSELKRHIRTHTGEKPYECQYCHRRFADWGCHLKHERTHTNEKPYKCIMCDKAFSLDTSLKAHQKIHTGEKDHKCVPCSKAFTLPHQLRAHLLTNSHRSTVQISTSLKKS